MQTSLPHHLELHQLKLDRLKEAIKLGDLQASRGEFSERTIDDIIADNEAAARSRACRDRMDVSARLGESEE